MTDSLVPLDLPSAVPEAEIVRIAAIAVSEVFVAQALEIEAVGGVVLPNESRRRTLGGIFSRAAIRASMARLGLLPPPPPPPASWATRAELIAGLHTGRGKVTTVKIMLMDATQADVLHPQVLAGFITS